MATEVVTSAVQQKLKDNSKGKGGGSEGEKIEPKEFFWDQFLTYVSSAIVALTVLNVSVEFLRGGGVTCFPPSARVEDGDTYEMSRSQSDYINNYCSQSVPRTEYFPIYILVHGVLLVAPHLVWSALFKGDFDSFFSIVEKLDRLRDCQTGEYNTKNVDRVTKLESEYGGKQKWIFRSYIGKLVLQALVCIGSIMFSGAFFLNFSFSFECPEDLSIDSLPEHWPVNSSLPCVYTSLRLLSLVRFADYLLLFLAIGLILFGLAWCFIRHTNELGYATIAKFAFQSCLTPQNFVFPKAISWNFGGQGRRTNQETSQTRKRKCPMCCNMGDLFKPRICNDLDFLLMRLFRADSSHGRVFKDIQVSKELRKHIDQDHQLLHLYINKQQDLRLQQEDQSQTDRRAEEDLRDYFRGAKFTENPEQSAFDFFRPRLGNTNFQPVSGIRDRFYGFVRFSPSDVQDHPTTELAVDISFGSSSIGYSLVLARAFKRVVSMNFHPFYQNKKEVCQKTDYYTNYWTATFPENIFSQSSEAINQVLEKVVHYIQDETSRKTIAIDFIVVGPLAQEAKKGSVNLLIDMLYTARLIGDGAILLAVRPLKVAHKIMTKRFFEFQPPKQLFDHEYHKSTVCGLLEEEVGFTPVDGVNGVAVECDDAVCVFEFVAYKFIGKYPPSAECTVAEGGSDSADGVTTDPSTLPKNNPGGGAAASNESQVQHSGSQPSPPPPSQQQLHGTTDLLAVAKEPSNTGQNEQPSSAYNGGVQEPQRSLQELKRRIKSLPPPPDPSRLPRQQQLHGATDHLAVAKEPSSTRQNEQPSSADNEGVQEPQRSLEELKRRIKSLPPPPDPSRLPRQQQLHGATDLLAVAKEPSNTGQNEQPKIVITRMSNTPSANTGTQYKNKNARDLATQSTATSQQTVTNGGSQMGLDELYTHFGSTSLVNMEAHSMQSDGNACSNGHNPFPPLASGDNRSADNVSHHSTEV